MNDHHPLSNYIALSKCKFPTLYRSNASVLHDIFFVIGTGYSLTDEGIVTSRYNLPYFDSMDNDIILLHTFECCTDERQKDAFEQYCKQRLSDKVRQNLTSLSDYNLVLLQCIIEAELKENLAAAVFEPVDNCALTKEALLRELSSQSKKVGYSAIDSLNKVFLRPYPISSYSIVRQLDVQHPKWLIELGLNLCLAWAHFLRNELKTNNVTETTDDHDFCNRINTQEQYETLLQLVKVLRRLIQPKIKHKMTKSKVTDTVCWNIQDSLKAGQSWTRQLWLDEPQFEGRHPRIIVVRNYSASSSGDEYQDQFVQIWDGVGSEPRLHMYPYRPCNEDWYAEDWLQVDNSGVPINRH